MGYVHLKERQQPGTEEPDRMESVEIWNFLNLQIKMMPNEVAMKQQGLIQGIFRKVKATDKTKGKFHFSLQSSFQQAVQAGKQI